VSNQDCIERGDTTILPFGSFMHAGYSPRARHFLVVDTDWPSIFATSCSLSIVSMCWKVPVRAFGATHPRPNATGENRCNHWTFRANL
jgi:hypothetical protein